jgi:hypothetical protein
MNRKELTTPLGFFNYALSYRAAADKLRICKLRVVRMFALTRPIGTWLPSQAVESLCGTFGRRRASGW